MELSRLKSCEEIIKTKPLYRKKTFFWEIGSIESVMKDGVQRGMSCEFEIGEASYAKAPSKWKLVLDLADDEPALTVQKVIPKDKEIFYRISAQVMKSLTEETDVLSYPKAKVFYDSSLECQNNNGGIYKKETRKFSFHRHLDYGCSYNSWFKDVLVSGSLLLKIDFETCECVPN